jgi:hypothetical protein
MGGESGPLGPPRKYATGCRRFAQRRWRSPRKARALHPTISLCYLHYNIIRVVIRVHRMFECRSVVLFIFWFSVRRHERLRSKTLRSDRGAMVSRRTAFSPQPKARDAFECYRRENEYLTRKPRYRFLVQRPRYSVSGLFETSKSVRR